MRSYTSHCATLIEVVNHVKYKGIIGCLAWSKTTCFTKTVIVVELVGSTPFGREGRICYHSVKLSIAKSIRFKCVTILNAEVAELDAVQKHVHTSQVVGRRVLLLSEYLVCMTYACCTEQQ